MKRLDFHDPMHAECISLHQRTMAALRILADHTVPIPWLLKFGSWMALLGAQFNRGEWENWERLYRRYAPPNADATQVRRGVALSRAIRLLGSRTYAPVWRRSPEWVVRVLRPEGLERLRALQNGRKGVIVLAFHVGLYVWVAPVLRALGFPLRPTHRRRISADALLLRHRDGMLRDSLPFPSQEESGLHLKRLYDLLHAGVWVQHVADYADPRGEFELRYFGSPFRGVRAPWQLARLSGAAAATVLILVGENLRPRLVVGPVVTAEELYGAESARRAIQSCFDFAEACVRREPWNISLKFVQHYISVQTSA